MAGNDLCSHGGDLAFETNWAVAPAKTASYSVSDGICHVEGQVERSDKKGWGAFTDNDWKVATLPEECRPEETVRFRTYPGFYVDILSNGDLVMGAGTATMNYWSKNTRFPLVGLKFATATTEKNAITSFPAGWGAYQGADGLEGPSYKLVDNVCYITGAVQTSDSSTQDRSQYVAYLPTECRPQQSVRIQTISGETPASIFIDVTGKVTWGADPGYPFDSSWISLSGIAFAADSSLYTAASRFALEAGYGGWSKQANYFVDGNYCRLEGTIYNKDGSYIGSETIAYLPENCRPKTYTAFYLKTAEREAYTMVYPDGMIRIIASGATTRGNYASLDGIEFVRSDEVCAPVPPLCVSTSCTYLQIAATGQWRTSIFTGAGETFKCGKAAGTTACECRCKASFSCTLDHHTHGGQLVSRDHC